MVRSDVSVGFIAGMAVAALLGGGAVAASWLPAGSVDTRQIVPGAVTNSRLGTESVGTKKIKSGAVTTREIKNATIQPIDFSWLVWNAIAEMPGRQGPAGATGAAGAPGPAGATGPTGATGPAGASGGQTILNGTGAPTSATGSDGDFYIDTAGDAIYGPKSSGAWPSPGTSLVGPQGPAGTAGTDGTDGTAVLSGTSDPTTQGTDGDFFINTASNTIFGPKASGAWPTPGTSLVGPQGPAGGTIPACSAQWSSADDQPSPASPVEITHDTVDATPTAGCGLSLAGPITVGGGQSHIVVEAAGRYNLQFSAQIEKVTSGTAFVRIWPETAPYSASACGTFTAVPNSASTGRQSSNGARMIMTVNFLLDLSANTCVRLSQVADAAGEAQLLHDPATADYPAVPSIITNIWRIG